MLKELAEGGGAPAAPPKQGDACLREALFMATDHAHKVDPTIAARYQRLMHDTRRHHTSAVRTIAGVLLTRIVPPSAPSPPRCSPGSSLVCAPALPTSSGDRRRPADLGR